MSYKPKYTIGSLSTTSYCLVLLQAVAHGNDLHAYTKNFEGLYKSTNFISNIELKTSFYWMNMLCKM